MAAPIIWGGGTIHANEKPGIKILFQTNLKQNLDKSL